MIDNIEFYTYESDLYALKDGCTELLQESSPIVTELLAIMQSRYTDAYNALAKEYKKSASNISYYNYLIVRRFCKCNFGELDALRKDINESGDMSFEKVKCPLRGECKLEGVVCCPVFNSTLSPAENRVGELLYRGCSTEEISEALYLSPNTVRNHYKSIYAKLGVHARSEFLRYAKKNMMYGD